MILVSASDYSLPALLAVGYGTLIVLKLLEEEFTSRSNYNGLEFTELLDRVERVPGEVTSSPVQERSADSRASVQLGYLSRKELLRRMFSNSSILAYLAQVDDGDACPEKQDLARRIQRERTRLRLWVRFYNFSSTCRWYAPGTAHRAKYAEKSYWSMVRPVCEFYSSHHSKQRSAALATAFVTIAHPVAL